MNDSLVSGLFTPSARRFNKQPSRSFPNINGQILAVFSTATSNYNRGNLKVELRPLLDPEQACCMPPEMWIGYAAPRITLEKATKASEGTLANLGFVGLGIMGRPMAQRLLAAGHEVALWSHTKGKAEAVGGRACSTPREVAEHSECVFVIVGDTAMSHDVILGENGLARGAKKGSIIADCSTIAPSASKAMAKELAALGINFLDAPCTGSKAGAENGTLTFMVGGTEEVFKEAKPWFEPMGKQFYFCGAAGQGLHAKLSQNMILGNLLQAFNESFVLSTKAGVPPELMLEIIENSAAKSGLVSLKAPLVFKRDWEPRFSVKWLEKDMQLMLDSAAELNVPVPLTSLSRQMYRAAIAKGYADDDIGASIRVLEEFAGVEVTPKR